MTQPAPIDRICREDTAEMNVLFVHSDIDDFGLNPSQFRIYAHILRRAGRLDRAWPGIDSMSRLCKMNRETVIEAIRFLEVHRLLRVQRTSGKSTIYFVTRRSQWVRPGNQSEIRNGADQSEMRNGVVGNRERHQSEIGNVRKSTEGDPVSKSKAVAAAPGVVEINGRKRKTKKIGKIVDPLGLRFAAIFNRSPETPWSDKEITALEEVHMLCITESRMRALEIYYASERKRDRNICRRDLLTLLNNANTEADRAVDWCERNSKSCASVRRRLWPNEFTKPPAMQDRDEQKRATETAATDEQRAEFLKRMKAWKEAGMPLDQQPVMS